MSRNVPPGEDARQDEAIVLLAAGATRTAVAEQIGVDRRTLHRWLRQEHFAGQVMKVRAEVFSEAVGVLVSGSRGAALKLVALSGDDHDNLRIQLEASTRVLQLVNELSLSADVERRLTALEAVG